MRKSEESARLRQIRREEEKKLVDEGRKMRAIYNASAADAN